MAPQPERPLRLDAPREDVLRHAAELVVEAWRSFDRFRPEEPPLDERVRRLLGTGLTEQGVPALEALNDAARILDESIAQPRPRYFAFIGSSGLEIGAVADLLAHTYDINLAVDARAAPRSEEQAVRGAGVFIGFPAATGAFTSGGTISNVTALAAARERALPGSRTEGLGASRVAVYCSVEVHHSITRAVELLGIGSANLRALPIDGDRRMQIDALTRAIDQDVAEGVTPIAVVAPARPTLTRAIDPIRRIAEVCADREVWVHVDGAYGLPAAAAPSVASCFDGLDSVDSVSVDAHKWLYLPKACGIVLVRQGADLANAFAHEEGYLPHQQHDLHAADITLEYSRPFRALKLWLAFRAHGAAQFRASIERNLAQARLLYDAVERTEDLETTGHPPQLSIVPFRHRPKGVRDVNAHNQALAEALQADGRVYLSSALIDGEVWLRPCFVNFRTTEEDVLALPEVTLEIGAKLAAGS
jgi:aromatic-L-amino-acid decarboxylase